MKGHFPSILARLVLVVDQHVSVTNCTKLLREFLYYSFFEKPKTPKALTSGPAEHQLYAKNKAVLYHFQLN